MQRLSQLTIADVIVRLNLGCQFVFCGTSVPWTRDDIIAGKFRGYCAVFTNQELLCYNCSETLKLAEILQTIPADDLTKHDIKNEIWLCERLIAELSQKITAIISMNNAK